MDKQGLAFLHDGVIYYSPNCSRHVIVPPRTGPGEYRFSRENAQLGRFQHPQWWTAPYGYLAFVPLIPKFDGAVFGCLHEIVAHICPSWEHCGSFVLRPAKAAEWLDLQDLLILVSSLIKNHTTFLLGPSLAPVAPSYLGFGRLFYTPHTARRRATIARDWFVVWMGQLSFLFGHFEHENYDIPRWFSFLESRGIAQSWLCGLQSSIVCDFSSYCPRVGVFLDFLENQKGQPSVSWYTSLNVPVWYPWTDRHQKAVRGDSRLAYLQPPPELLQAAATLIIRTPTAILPSSLLPSSSAYSQPHFREPYSPSPLADNAPLQETYHDSAVSTMSGADFLAAQKAYIETKPWLQFFQARDERNKNKLANETPAQRQTRLNRERKPPVNKVDVFLWDWSDEDPQQLVRTKVNRREGGDILSSYSDSQLVYDSFSNVWDACAYFGDPDDDGDDESVDGCEVPVSTPIPSGTAVDDVGTSEQADHEAFCQNRVRQLDAAPPSERFKKLAFSYSLDADSRLDFTQDTFDILAYLSLHYGFVAPLPLRSSSSVNPKDWEENIKNVGLDIETNPLMPDLAAPVVTFLQGLRLRDGPVSELWDLHLGNCRKVNTQVLATWIFRREKFFFVHLSSPDEPHCPWTIALTTAADALFVYRLLTEKHLSTVSLGYILVDEGIRFRTLLPLPHSSVTSSIRPFRAVIPIRVRDYCFEVSDYHSYVRERARILSSPRGRAALLEGGIIGRIAKEHLGHDCAALGPSSAVTVHRQGFSFTDAAGITYWDDRLTDDEIHLICGLYHCYTGKKPLLYCHLCLGLIL